MATPNLPKAHFPWRVVIYGIAILYLAADMYVFHGPLHKMIERMQGRGIEQQVAKVPTGLIATVDTHPITVADLERGVWEYCTVRGMKVAEVDPKRLEVIRAVILGRLIDDIILWNAARLNPVEFDKSEVDTALAQIRGHFPDEQLFIERLAAQDMDLASFRAHLADQVHQRKWLEAKAAPYITACDQEIQKHYEADIDARTVPERWRARHLFMGTLDKNPVEIGAQIAAVSASIAAGELTFEEAVKTHSEDERSNKIAGDLGYFSASRMPEDFIEPISAQELSTVGAPFQTKLGWHIVEVTEHLPEREATLDEMREEIRAYIENQKRENVIDQIVRDLRKRSKIWPREPRPRAIMGSNASAEQG